MQFKDFYEIPKFKKLDKIGKTIFVFSFLFPALILYTFLHLYFLPFGLDKDYSLEDKDVSIDKNFFYEIDGQEVLDGVAEIKVEPRIAKRNPTVTASVEGDNVYIIPHRIKNDDIFFNPEFSREFEEDFDYLLIDDYVVKDEEILVFKIEYEINWGEQWNNELLLKYENIRVIQNSNSVELRIDKQIGESLNAYSTYLQFYSEDRDTPIVLYAIYKKPNENNGFIELVGKNRVSRRSTIPSLEKKTNDEVESYEINTIWNPELEKDLSQRFISLKQEQYTQDLLQKIPFELDGITTPELYYKKIYKPDYENENFEEDFIFDPEDPYTRNQVFYKKQFYNDFQGDIAKISVGYEYPINQKKTLETIVPNTPFSIQIVGENSEIEDLKINLYREPMWKKF